MPARECATCGAVIQESTAEETGGVCIPCHRGTRQEIDEAKRRYSEEREKDRTNPVRIHWRELVQRAVREGFDSLKDREQRYYAARCVAGETFRGGLHSYFANTPGSVHSHALVGLKEMGALATLSILERAKTLCFADLEVPEDVEERDQLLDRLLEDGSPEDEELTELEREFYRDSDDLYRLLDEYPLSLGLVEDPVRQGRSGSGS